MMPAMREQPDGWQKTACILCSQNCGIEVALDGRRLARLRGDRAHPTSQGYACEKAQRLDFYQNARGRLTSPLRRRPDGSFEEIDWDTAIREVAERFAQVRDAHGGESIFYYGGGGQGNHLGGGYSRATRAALGSTYASNALAQEKTGEFWVDGQLYGKPRCHTCGDFEHAEVAVFIGKNPWQSHGLPRARVVLKALSSDPARTLVVIDPRRTETAAMADFHLQVRPGGDPFVLAALLAVLVQEDLVAHDFIRDRTNGFDQVRDALAGISVADYAARAGVPEAQVREVARRIGTAKSVATYEDLGVQQAPHSTLNSYLEKLIYLVTGNFAKRGAMNLHSHMVALVGGSERQEIDGRWPTTPVGGHRIISGMVPCNVIAEEILNDHPKRFRAMLVESANPAHSLADSARMREALAALDLVVVIDVAMTETARLAHYVLPAASQYEKWEATFFNLEFPHNSFQLRAPILEPLPGTLAEPEIHHRLVRALGAISDDDLAPLHAAAKQGRGAYGAAFFAVTGAKPHLRKLAPVVLYETLGPTLGDGAAAAAALWAAAHLCAMAYPDSVRRAGFEGVGPALGEQLFEAILTRRSGVTFTIDDYDETWRRVETKDKRIRLAVPVLLDELARLAAEDPSARDPRFPFILSAGERRSSTANTIFRDPGWRKKDGDGALRISPADATRLGLVDGGRARVTTKAGTVTTTVEVTDSLQPGHASLPNGLGVDYPDADGRAIVHGVAPNELTSAGDRDWIAGTPWHKHVPANIEAV
jgi:anaerobic selenocysteine-containing dehydrogenase